jgi:4'-phosphopantetheinyl transferase
VWDEAHKDLEGVRIPEAAPISRELKPGETHLWRVDLDRNLDALPAIRQVLAPEERAKADRFRFDRDRNRYILAHGALRAILASYLDTTPAEPMFRYGPQGKPELRDGALRFSLSRSGDLVLCAISPADPVGVDVERVSAGVDDDVAGCFCTPRALRLLQALPRPARRRAFFQAWTRMEAYSKARGAGLARDLDTLDPFLEVSKPGRPGTTANPERERRWRICSFSPRRGYIAALAVRSGNGSCRYWMWQTHNTRQPWQWAC